jgi:nucleotide-binding universal stress UspA family protein
LGYKKEDDRVFETILICLDSSESARKELLTGLEISEKFLSSVICLSVYDQSCLHAVGAFTPGAVVSDEVVSDHAAAWHASVERCAVLHWRQARVPVRLLRDTGDPVELIVETAKREHAGLIVMGSRGKSDFAKRLLGSVSDGVLRLAPCPVMIVR